MAQPEWKTSAGNLGTYPAEELLSMQMKAIPVFPANQVFYKLLSGELPPGISIDLNGLLTGIPNNVSTETTTVFTLRATDNMNNYESSS